tara:strand:+ start:715 stop:1062 length:348 start_codon:yes stop_codon:yes gene_type:complete
MDNLKLPIALVIAMILQISGGVWWVSQQAATISNLQETVSEMSSRVAQEKEINLKRDVEDIKYTLEYWGVELDEELDELWEMENSLSLMLTEQIKLKGRVTVLEKQLEIITTLEH